MGTETFLEGEYTPIYGDNPVKFNNPLMGTETYFYTRQTLFRNLLLS